MALRVFISYTHDSQKHMDRVWNLSERLRGDGVDCRIDQHEESPEEGWPRWCRNQVQESQFVLIVCTETYQRRYEGKEEYGKGRGGQWEGFVIIQELYETEGRNTKFIPVVFSSADSQYIPIELRAATYYDLSKDEEYNKLFRRITKQPARIPSSVAPSVRQMPPMVELERKSPSADALEIRWNPGEKTYDFRYVMPEGNLNIQYRLCIVNVSGRHLIDVNVKLQNLTPHELSCVPCDLQLMNDNPDPGAPHITTFSLAPGGERFIDLLLQWPNSSTFWILHTVPKISRVVTAQAYSMTIKATAANASPVSQDFELTKNGSVWDLVAPMVAPTPKSHA